jgi:uncharacterized membrane protein
VYEPRAVSLTERPVYDPGYNRHPLGPALLAALAALVAVLGTLFVLDALRYAYREIGLQEGTLFAIIVASLVGGAVNIPVLRWRTRATVVVAEVVVFGVRYRVPVLRRAASTILAVNLGGAVIPAVLSSYLLLRDPGWWRTLVAVAIVAAAVHHVARAVPGLGIAVPALLPPAISCAAALMLNPDRAAAAAYVAGTLGTLVGADLLNLHEVKGLAPGVVSIGGAGTFDGIFISGIAAVLLVGLA